ncbi:Signal recognition particle core component [Modicella reniformis]|uniref:Signal recognition particle subunit SRP72 n=1 Tax=Modicella reniformis TaxID=1440133 RepID=A0A9P6MLZ4_9FUNG|nr:Signal recognition particle core component [Modicella reniformis]
MAAIQQLFGELERHIKREEHNKVLALTDKILAIDPKDKDALHCKAITLIRLERYTDALTILNRPLQGKFVFEKAYCLYRTNQLADGALVIENTRKDLEASGKLPWNLRHLEAQILYRMERYQDCIDLYASMLRDASKVDDAYTDILTNYRACKAAVLYAGMESEQRWGKKLEDEEAAQDEEDNKGNAGQSTYELSFNAACAQIAKGDYTQALKLLEEAKSICREALGDYDEEEIEQEMAILVVQTAYVYQLLGRAEKARELYQSVLKIKALEVTVPAVAANNLVVLQKEDDLFDSHKKIKTATTKALGVKFFSSQKRVIAMNELLLNLYQNKFVACRDTARQLLKSQPDNDALYLILAATTHKQKKTAKALEELKEYAATRPQSVAIQFAIVQLELLLSSNGQDYTATIESLTRFLKGLPEKEQHRPGYVALLVWLYDQAGQGEKGVEILTEAAAVWAKPSKDNKDNKSNKKGGRKNTGGSSGSSTIPLTLLRQTATFKLRSHRYKEAAKDYEELVRADPSDPTSIAGLIMAYSEYEPALAEKYGASLPEMKSTTIASLDVDALEKVVPGLKREYVSTEGTRTMAAASIGLRRRPGSRPHRTGARKAHKRKPLLPKNFDPATAGAPDPERWLSKRDRAAARLARTRKTGAGSRKEMGKGSQGMNMEGGGIGGTGSARIAGREHLVAAAAAATPVPATEASSKAEESTVDIAAIAKAKSSSSSANKKKKGKGKAKW